MIKKVVRFSGCLKEELAVEVCYKEVLLGNVRDDQDALNVVKHLQIILQFINAISKEILSICIFENGKY